MKDNIYYDIIIKGTVYKNTVYDSNDIIKVFCDLVNGYGINPDDITVKTFINGQEKKGSVEKC